MRQSRSGSGAAVGRGVVQERFSAFKVFMDRAREDRDPSRLFFLGSLSLAEMPQCVPLDMIDLLHRTHTFWPVLDVVLTLRIKTTVRTAWGGRDGERGHRPAGQRGSPPHPHPPARRQLSKSSVCTGVSGGWNALSSPGRVRERGVLSAR